MKVKVNRISEHIWSLKIWIGIPIHIWLAVDRDGVTLIDAGISLMSKSIIKQIIALEAGPLKQILLTHGHADHVGAVKRICNTFHIPVYVHELEIPYMNGELPYPGRKKAQQTVPKPILQPLGIDDSGKLLNISGLTPYHTPGHSPGHVVYFHEADRILLGGDLFTSKKGELRSPIGMFTSDMEQAVDSSNILRELQPKKVLVSHGEPVRHPANQLDAYQTMMKKRMINKGISV